jgi:hypothetical protein
MPFCEIFNSKSPPKDCSPESIFPEQNTLKTNTFHITYEHNMRTSLSRLSVTSILPALTAGALLLLAGCTDSTKKPEVAKEIPTDAKNENSKPEPSPTPARNTAKSQLGKEIQAEFAKPGPSSTLPAWLNDHRVELHWEGPLLYVEEDGTPDNRFAPWLKNVQSRIKGMDPGVTVGLSKKGAEGAWWPSKVGESLPEAKDRNIFKEFFLDPMDGSGIKFVAYYRHDIDKPMEAQHPEWLSLDANGQLIANMDRDKTAHRLCFNSPYREIVKTRLVELAEMGTAGVYFDQDHMSEVCICENCKAKFLAVRGYPMPEKLRPYTNEYLDVAKFIGDTISETFAEWRAALRKVNSDMVFIAGADELVDFLGIHNAESLSDSIDVLKSEFQKCFGGQQHFPGAPLCKLLKSNPEYYAPTRAQQESLVWIIARDAGGGRPAHIWNYKPDKDFGETFHTNMALVAHGDISSTTLEVMSKTHSYNELFQLSKLLGKEFADARPYGWAGVYISNAIKEQAYPAEGRAATSYRQTFEQLFAPVLASTDALQKQHIPFITLFDKDIRAGQISPLTKVLIVPSADLLPADLQASLAKLEANGVKVIRLSSKDTWYLASSVPTLQENLLKDIATQAGQPPIQVEGPADVRTNYFLNHGGTGFLVTAIRDWNYFWFFGQDKTNRRASFPELDPVTGMKLIVRDPALEVESAKVVDFKESPSVEITQNGTMLNLPPLPIYQFIQANCKK